MASVSRFFSKAAPVVHATGTHNQAEPDSLFGTDRADRLLNIDHAAQAMQLPVDVVRRALQKGALRGVEAPEPRVSAKSVEVFLMARVAANRTVAPPKAA